MVVTILALGLRKLRAEIRLRIDAWKTMAAIELPPPPPVSPLTNSAIIPDHKEPLRVRNAFQTSFDLWLGTGGWQYIRSLRWAIPTAVTAAARFRATAQFSTRVTDARIITALSGIGVPFDTTEGITWGNGFATWYDVLQAVVSPCECAIPALCDSPGILKRCSHCHGQVTFGTSDPLARCSLCNSNTDSVCAVCAHGFHVGRSAMCQGANRSYRSPELDGVPVCPDCICLCAKTLSLRSVDLSDFQQTEVRAIMEKAAVQSRALIPTVYEFVKEFVLSHHASVQDLVQAIQARNITHLSLDAATLVNRLIAAGVLDLLGDRLYWIPRGQQTSKKPRRGH